MASKRHITVFTASRSEYGALRGLLKAIDEHSDLTLSLIVSGSHLSERDGMTISEIEEDGFQIASQIEMYDEDRTQVGITRALGVELAGLAAVLDELKPDIVLVNGDRSELLPLATAALTMGIPLAHIAGGEITEGAIDDAVRHAVSKLSHLHFVTNELHGERLRKMGEEKWRIVMSGEPALDQVLEMPRMSREDLEKSLDIGLNSPVIMVTYHPETLGFGGLADLHAMLEAMAEVEACYVITYPNADHGGGDIIDALRAFCEQNPRSILVSSLGQKRYYSMMGMAAMMLGNSSSGLWEAPSFSLPVVNIGNRQQGRLKAINVIDVAEVSASEVKLAIEAALSDGFRKTLEGMGNPYGDGRSVDRVIEKLVSVELGVKLLRKKWVDDEC